MTDTARRDLGVILRRFENPDEIRTVEKGRTMNLGTCE